MKKSDLENILEAKMILKNATAIQQLQGYITETIESVNERLDADEGNGIREYLNKQLENMLFAVSSL